MKKLLSFLCLLVPVFALAQEDIECRVEAVLSRLTVEQKIGQLTQCDGRKKVETLKGEIRKGNLTSIMNITDPELINELQKVAVEESPTRIPILFARDVVHGFKTILPIPLGMAASFDEALIEKVSRNTAMEATERGIRWAFAPMMDIARDPRWGRICETLGEDTYMAGRLASAVVRGYQGQSLSDPFSMAACAKHFAGYGASEGGRDYNVTYISPRALRDVHLPPFKASIDAGCASVMSSFNDNDGLPSTCNPELLTEILRNQWGFDGVVVSDWASVYDPVKMGVVADKRDAAKQCLNAGCDIDMVSNCYLRNLKDLIESGEVKMETLDEAVRRVLRLKFRLGLFDEPYTKLSESSVIYSDQVMEDARILAQESIVLLKNDKVLPLSKEVKKVLLTGPMAHAQWDQMGSWSMDGEKEHTRTPRMVFQQLLGEGVEVEYISGLEYPRDKSAAQFKNLVKAARKADVVIAVVGEEAVMSGEAHSLSSLDLQGRQTEMLELLAQTGTPLVTVIMSGRSMTIVRELEISDALLYAWQPGTMGGPALADIISGKANPSGKLPVTFPRNVGQIPIYYNYKLPSRKAKGTEGNLDDVPREAAQSVMGHTSSYLDVSPLPLFPFGYGLSYTTFEISDIALLTPEVNATEAIKVSVTLANTGSVAGPEVLQVYTSRKSVASVTQPVKELKDFCRLTLAPGEKRVVEFEIPVDRLAFHNRELKRVVEPGKYRITIGTDSQSGLTLPFEIIR